MEISFSLKALTTAALLGTAGLVMAHGNVTPQPVDTGNLPVLGDEILAENPFRQGGSHGDANALAVEIGESAYAGTEWDDEYYMGRVQNGTDRGMPSWKKTLEQNAIWAIRTYVESLPKPE